MMIRWGGGSGRSQRMTTSTSAVSTPRLATAMPLLKALRRQNGVGVAVGVCWFFHWPGLPGVWGVWPAPWFFQASLRGPAGGMALLRSAGTVAPLAPQDAGTALGDENLALAGRGPSSLRGMAGVWC